MNTKITSLLGALGIGICITSGTAAAATVIVAENFGGNSTTNLPGTTADTFAPAIVTAGGSATWVGSALFKADGSIANTQFSRSVHLNLGSYINDAKGQSNGLFELTTTISPTTGTWLSVGFSNSSAPPLDQNFTGAGGLGTMVYRDNANNAIGSLAGPGSTNNKGDTATVGGDRTLTIVLDVRGSFPSLQFFDSEIGQIASHNFTTDQNFNSILLSTASTSGTYSALSLTQIPEPGAALLGGLGLLALLRRRR